MGFLTDSDRDVLQGEHPPDLDDRAIEQREVRARRRIREAVTDFSEVWEKMDESNRRFIFQPNNKANTPADEIRRGLRDMIRVAYLGLREVDPEADVRHIVETEIDRAEDRLQLEREGEIEELRRVVSRAERGEGPFSSEDAKKLMAAGALRLGGHELKPKEATVEVEYADDVDTDE